MAQLLDSKPILTPKKIETWARTKLNTCPVPTPFAWWIKPIILDYGTE